MLTPPPNPKCPSCGTHLPLLIGREQLDALFAMLQDIQSRLEGPGAHSSKGRDTADPKLLQVVEFEAGHAYLGAGDRARLAEEKLDISRATYYRYLKRARELGLMSLMRW
ncbi:MAG: hypothetical protein ACPGJF_05635 [Sinimarinibacterium flocculans]|uniref:hypothetical protein n=1 Tax=Sinimarinibacterium flocculans TaxID=985250 RepID=UPI003C3623FB